MTPIYSKLMNITDTVLMGAGAAGVQEIVSQIPPPNDTTTGEIIKYAFQVFAGIISIIVLIKKAKNNNNNTK